MFVPVRPYIYARPFIAGCAPFMPRPVIPPPMPFWGGFGCHFRPMMPVFPMPAFTMPFSFGVPPFFSCGNIFIQNMMATAAKLAYTNAQRAAAMQKYRENYKFGTLTARTNQTNYTPYVYNNTYNNNTSSLNYTPAVSSQNYKPATVSGSNSSLWSKMGYCASSGIRLARTALSRAVGFTGWCARYVKNAIASCGLGSYVSGDAYEMIDILRNNKNFKEIPARGVNPRTLPPGCILVYERGVSGYSSKYGHTEITTGDGRAVSDGITNNIRGNITAIFMPVA